MRIGAEAVSAKEEPLFFHIVVPHQEPRIQPQLCVCVCCVCVCIIALLPLEPTHTDGVQQKKIELYVIFREPEGGGDG